MSRFHTRYIDFRELKDRGLTAGIVIKLMMVCNDLSFANQALADWKEDQEGGRQTRQKGAKLYSLRLQMAHLYEGFDLVRAIKADETLMGLLERCDLRTQESFRSLESYLPGGTQRQRFEQILGRIRNNLTFHYDESGKLIGRAIAELSLRPDPIGSVTRASTAHNWYFEAADRVLNSIVCFQGWSIPKDAPNLSERADAIAMECHEIFLRFVDFAGELIWRYVGKE
jgi:hypothetical protein